MKLDIVYAPDKRLSNPVADTTVFDANLREAVLDMKAVLTSYKAVGLASNQVGLEQYRIALVTDDKGVVYTCVNLKVLEGWGNRYVPEGCLSLPGIEIIKRRPEKVYASYNSESGENLHVYAEGLLANTICHEADHLDGILMTDIDNRVWKDQHNQIFHGN
jgi:peptide deformylase